MLIMVKKLGGIPQPSGRTELELESRSMQLQNLCSFWPHSAYDSSALPFKIHVCKSYIVCMGVGCLAHTDAEVFVGRRKGTSRGKEERVGQRLFPSVLAMVTNGKQLMILIWQIETHYFSSNN